MIWFGADPGGKNNFGVAVRLDDATYRTECVSFVEQAIGGSANTTTSMLLASMLPLVVVWTSGDGTRTMGELTRPSRHD
jgi:hypothetical protein